MATTQRKGTKIRGVKKEILEAHQYQITHIKLADTCVIDKDNLRVFETGIFVGQCKKPDGQVIQVNMMPDNFWAIHVNNDVKEFFSRMALDRYFSLKAWGIDVKRCWR